MITNYKALTFFISRAFRKIIRIFFDFMPVFINSFFASKGFTYLTSRKKSFFFESFIYGTKLKIKAHSLSNVQRVATSNKFINDDFVYSYCDPILGVFKLKLKNWTMIDIGANVGTYSLASTVAGANKIYSLEPGNAFEHLNYNVKLNGLENIISTFKLGISDSDSEMNWHEELNNPGNAHLLNSKRDLNFSKTNTLLNKNFSKVNVISLTNFIKNNQIDKIDLIKIDVEGMEWDILKNSEEIIGKFQPIFLIETHRIMSDIVGYDCITPIFDLMYRLEYESYMFDGNRFEKFIYPNFPMDTFFIPKKNSVLDEI